jgi:hemolysin activation/secretion protein
MMGVAAAADPVAAGAAAAVPAVDAGAAPSTDSAQSFDIREYRVLGNSVLTARDIEQLLYPLLGAHKTLTDVGQAKDALEKLYHDRGFQTVFVDIPPQDVGDGIVRLKVSEGRLRERTVSGARYFSERHIVSELPAAAPGTVPQLAQLQQQLQAVNSETPDRSVVPVLRAGPEPGTVDLALKVDDHLPLHANVDFNNQNTPDTSPQRASVGVSYTDLFGELDTISAQYQDVPAHLGQAGVFQAAFSYHPLAFGIRPSLSFIDSTSNFATLGGAGVLGKGQIVGLRVSVPLFSGPASVQALTMGLDYKHFRNTITTAGSPGLVTPIAYYNASLAYNGTWPGQRESGSLNASANFGPRGLTNEDAIAFSNDRYQGRSNYFYVRADASETTILPARFALKLRVAGQYAVEPLITNEDISIAGADGVRGYLEAEELADRGIKGSVQLQAPPLLHAQRQLGDLFMFLDEARAETIEPLPGQPSHAILRSWGAGINLLPGGAVNGSFTWAHPLDSATYTREGESRWLFDLRGSF